MVARDDDGGVFIEILRLDPPQQRGQLPAGAGVDILVILGVFAAAQVAMVPAHMGRVRREHRKREGLPIRRHVRNLILGIGVEVFVLHPPPDPVVLRDVPLGLGRIDIINPIHPVVREIAHPPQNAALKSPLTARCIGKMGTRTFFPSRRTMRRSDANQNTPPTSAVATAAGNRASSKNAVMRPDCTSSTPLNSENSTESKPVCP